MEVNDEIIFLIQGKEERKTINAISWKKISEKDKKEKYYIYVDFIK